MSQLPPSIHSGFIHIDSKLGITGNSGYGQTRGEARGMADTMNRLQEELECYPRIKVYDCRVWKDNGKRQAKEMKRDGITHAINLGYSYGGGYGANKLARAEIKCGIRPELVLLCDPVYRNLALPTLFSAIVLCGRSLMPGSAKITYPKEVTWLRGLRQTKNIPSAHDIRKGKKGRTIRLPAVADTNIGHSEIDDCKEWNSFVDASISPVVDLFKKL